MTVVALTMGEPAGIGGEIALQAWHRRRPGGVPPFVVIDDADRLAALAERIGWPTPLARVDTAAAAPAAFPSA